MRLVLTQAQVGQTITVRVSYIDGGGTTETLTAAPTTTVTNINDTPTGLPTITGTPTQGIILTMNTAAIRDADGLGTFTYQWQGAGNDISGATDTLLVLTQDEVGQTITVRVSYIDGGGTTETLTAAPTTTVTISMMHPPSAAPPPPLLPKTPPINSFQKEVIKMQTICRSIHCPITPLGYQWTRTWAN